MNNGPEEIQRERDAAPPTPASSGGVRFASGDRDPHLEAALQQVLQPEAAPEGFADRVMARALAGDRPALSTPGAAERPKGNLLHWPDRRLWISGLVAALLVAGVFGGGLAIRRAREQQRRIVEATQQFETTERVTVHALAQARQQLQRAGVPLALD